MNHNLKKLAQNIFSTLDIHIVRLTDKKELEIFLKKLRPMSCNKELIRLGPDGDGGYLVPNDLKDIEACFSPGVDYISGFEEDCANMGMEVFLADKSVDKPAKSHPQFHFTKKYIGVTTNNDYMTLDNWVKSSVPSAQKDLLLQIDVEGFEYEVFFAASDQLLNRFRIIVAEFHNLDQLWSRPFFELVSRVFDKILQTHTCVHIHPNNCCGSVKHSSIEIPSVIEITFLRNDRVKNPSPANVFPHLLDRDNTQNPPLPLPKCWYR